MEITLSDGEITEIKQFLASGPFTPREEKVLLMWLGIHPFDKDYSVDEIADRFSLSRARAQEVLDKALRKLRVCREALDKEE